MQRLMLILLVAFAMSCQPENKQIQVESPSGNLKVELLIGAGGKVYYQVLRKSGDQEEVVMGESPLGLIRDDADFSQKLKVQSVSKIKPVTEEYTMVSGKQSNLAYDANEAVVSLINESGEPFHVVFRIFDEGLAFRYIFPEESGEQKSVVSETTGFAISVNSDGWMSPYQAATSWGNPGYEDNFIQVKAGEASPEKVGWAFPLLFKSGDNWLFISEAGLNAGYCGTHIKQNCTGGIYSVAMPESNERLEDGSPNPSSTLPWKMPWRFVLVGETLNQIVESSMVYHLSEPAAIEDVSWIKPGRASWEWWSSKSGRTVKNLNHFVDLAADMGWEYSLVDAGWEKMPDGTIEDVIDHAYKRNVGLLVWYNSGGRRDSLARNEEYVMFNDDTRRAEMKRLQEWGIKGIKVDFFATDKQFGIELYEKILKDAAQHNLLVNFHGCTMPRGWTRTWPHLLTMEAVRGAECYRFSSTYPEIAPSYSTIAAIIRGTAGPTDFTPATFSNSKNPHVTSPAHELALTVVYESGIIHMADTPESYSSLPEFAIQFLKEVPAAWDESKLVHAVPGEIFVVARRKGDKWYVAGINGKNEKQIIKFPLPGTLNNNVLISDSGDKQMMKSQNIAGQQNSVTVEMMPFGGFVLH